MLRALGPLPSTTSSLKSSNAGYSTSSTARGIRWISSTNKTSPSSRLVRIAARSPARSRAGPEVGWNPTRISWATMLARVVLPNPGGPLNKLWSTGSPRERAPSINNWSCSLIFACPTNSSNVRGRSALSKERSSSPSSLVSTRRSSTSTVHDLLVAGLLAHARPTFCSASRSKSSTGRSPSEASSPIASVASCGLNPSESRASRTSASGPSRTITSPPKPILEVEHDALCDLLPDAGNHRQGRNVAGDDRPPQRVRRQRREERERHLGSDAGHARQEVEELRSSGDENPYSVMPSSRTTILVWTFARVPTAGSLATRRGRDREVVADTSGLEHHTVRTLFGHGAREERDHRATARSASSRNLAWVMWHTATATASAASGCEGTSLSPWALVNASCT